MRRCQVCGGKIMAVEDFESRQLSTRRVRYGARHHSGESVCSDCRTLYDSQAALKRDESGVVVRWTS